MPLQKRRQFALSSTLALAGIALGRAGRVTSARAASAGPSAEMPPPEPLVHALNRISFGIRPEELEHARRVGWPAYLEEQLYLQADDDPQVEAFVAARFPSLSLSAPELAALSPEQRRRAGRELVLATLYRGLFGRRQLFELMVDFWSNHFNINQADGPLQGLKIIDDRDVIRTHALGRFRELLHASAKSPAMLYYLDNYSNTRAGPNENYARELLELHTLGVDGGYTEQDVIETARCFTGWSIDRRERPGTFRFYPERHDTGEKLVLGEIIPAGGGIEDGERVLDILARHPSTARFIATKLGRRFVADDPPASLVDKVALAYRNSGGDIKALLRTLLLSSEFDDAFDRKFRRPLDFLLAALRTSAPMLSPGAGADIAEWLGAMGQAPFRWPAPNGYPDTMDYWANTNGLLHRWNFVLALGGGTLRGLHPDLRTLSNGARTPEDLVDRMSDRLLHRTLSVADRDTLIDYVRDGLVSDSLLPTERLWLKTAGLFGLLLGSGYFQMR